MVNVTRIGAASVAAALALSAVVAAAAGTWRSERSQADAMAAQSRTIAALRAEVESLRATSPDWASVVAQDEPSVVTVFTDEDLGSGWVVRSDKTSADILTNYHVVADALDKGEHDFRVVRFDHTMSADVVRADRADDLALLRVGEKLPALVTSTERPAVGAPVMDLGSPLGLKGSVSVGVVAAFRSIFGSDYLQFTAPISPGDSGGPLVDGAGRVVGIATAKIVYDGAESLGLAIPVQVACAALADCVQA